MPLTISVDGEYDFDLAGHHYTGILLEADAGFDLAIRLSGALVDPVVTALGRPLIAAIADEALVERMQAEAKKGDPDFAGALVDMDAGGLVAALQALDLNAVGGGMREVLSAFDQRTVKAILASTYRDGEHLANSAAWNRAYRGNYMEAVRAAWMVAQGNGFLPDIATIVSGLRSAVTAPTSQSGRRGAPGTDSGRQPGTA